ncbi:MAG TPA: glycoside hydrolase family 31 protein [Chthonomonadaceae bacterium]|nr:glycoside hydrolase family 31 protein [Chthonomonadaceae bacterium]
MNAFTHAMQLAIHSGEYWWGGVVQDGVHMPFPSGGYAADLRNDFRGNQAAPLLLSSQGRYIWCDSAFAFSIGKGEICLRAPDSRPECGEGFGTLAGAYRAACRRFFPPSGRMPDPLAFTAPQYNTWIEMPYEPTQEKVLHYARSILEHGMPPGVLTIDDNWCEDYGVWNFHPGRFPDPDAMVRQLHAWGFKVMLWFCPFVSPDSPTFRDLAARRCLIRGEDHAPLIRKWWNGYSALLDLTHPRTLEWVNACLDQLVREFGIDGFKFDGGDPEYYAAEDGIHAPARPEEYCEAWGRIGLRYSLSEYRACWKLAGQHLIQRLRDKHPAWGRDGLADLIPNGLAQGLAGYAFICPDMIGGGEIASLSKADFALDQELFVRTTQCATLFPIMQFSMAPWRLLDTEHLDGCLEMVALRRKMGPEIVRLARHAAQTGEPILRPLAYEFPECGLEPVTDQFMLGEDILVAPVLRQGATTRTVVFPPGAWADEDGRCLQGPAEIEVEAPLGRLPWYRRVA